MSTNRSQNSGKGKQQNKQFTEKAWAALPQKTRTSLIAAAKQDDPEARKNSKAVIARINQAMDHAGFDRLDHSRQLDFLDALSSSRSPQERNATWEFYLGTGELIVKPNPGRVRDIATAPSARKPKSDPKQAKAQDEKKPARRRAPLKARDA